MMWHPVPYLICSFHNHHFFCLFVQSTNYARLPTTKSDSSPQSRQALISCSSFTDTLTFFFLLTHTFTALLMATLCSAQRKYASWAKMTIKYEHLTDLSTALLKHLGHSITRLLTLFAMIYYRAIAIFSVYFSILSFAAHLPQTPLIWAGRVLRCGPIGHLHTSLSQD